MTGYSTAPNGEWALAEQETGFLTSLLASHDRGGFYMAYNAMFDSAEAGLQARIATFEAFINTGDRTFLEYLLKPIEDSFSRAFREE